MTARESDQKRGMQSAPAVPMHRLLASCAAADAVSKPPPSERAEGQDVPRVVEVPDVRTVPESQPGQDAA